MEEQIKNLYDRIKADFKSLTSLSELTDLKVKLTGRKGEITLLLKSLSKLDKSERPKAGQLINELREKTAALIKGHEDRLNKDSLEKSIIKEAIDVTLPGKARKLGHLHPLSTVLDEIKDLFIGMGFTIADGPEIETDYYNFEALNIPANHPVKDEQDTFYVDGGFVLRTQTSGVQVRVMENTSPPIRIIAPGKVYRSDDWDATHGPIFHQIEGLLVDEDITMADLKGILTIFARNILGKDIKVRFRPSFFPFTEPSAEMDVVCYACNGVEAESCNVCKGAGWVELLGCGMVHPNVLKNCNIDPHKYSGYAFGMGIDRVVMQRFQITDMRLLFENDMKFLNQF